MSLLVVGSIAFDAVRTPFGEREHMLGGSAVHFSLAASFFTDVRVVGPVGDDFGEDEYAVLRDRGVSMTHLHVSTLKPFTDPQVTDAIAEARQGVISMENHSIVGGLGSATAELMAESGTGKPLLRIGIQDRYSHGATRHTLMRENQLDALSLVRGVERLVDADLGVGEDDLAAVRIEAVHSEAKAEAL